MISLRPLVVVMPPFFPLHPENNDRGLHLNFVSYSKWVAVVVVVAAPVVFGVVHVAVPVVMMVVDESTQAFVLDFVEERNCSICKKADEDKENWSPWCYLCPNWKKNR